MENISIVQTYGKDAKAAIDEFYKKNGSKATAREKDLFFIAYSAQEIKGCVRFCIEEDTPMLRTMHVDSTCRHLGIGRRLLEAFSNYLDNNKVHNVFCLPYLHLEKFYGLINFKIVEATEAPKFLVNRAAEYAQNGTHTLFMRRL